MAKPDISEKGVDMNKIKVNPLIESVSCFERQN